MKIVAVALTAFLSGCVSNIPSYTYNSSTSKTPMDYVQEFVDDGRWEEAYRNVENAYLLADKAPEAFQTIRANPKILSEGAPKYLVKGCINHSEKLTQRRYAMFDLMEKNGFDMKQSRHVVTLCMIERINKTAEAKAAATKKQIKELKRINDLKAELDKAQLASEIRCSTQEKCRKIFALSQVFVNEFASRKIQIATDTVIETYNPEYKGDIAMTVYRLPQNKGEKISVQVNCKATESIFNLANDLCYKSKKSIYASFRPFVEGFMDL